MSPRKMIRSGGPDHGSGAGAAGVLPAGAVDVTGPWRPPVRVRGDLDGPFRVGRAAALAASRRSGGM